MPTRRTATLTRESLSAFLELNSESNDKRLLSLFRSERPHWPEPHIVTMGNVRTVRVGTLEAVQDTGRTSVKITAAAS
jgi:hypothetical protein